MLRQRTHAEAAMQAVLQVSFDEPQDVSDVQQMRDCAHACFSSLLDITPGPLLSILCCSMHAGQMPHTALSKQAVFQVSLDVPPNVTALSNTHAVQTTQFSSLGSRLDFAPTPLMSSYLVAICVGNLVPLQAGRHSGGEQRESASEPAVSILTYSQHARLTHMLVPECRTC